MAARDIFHDPFVRSLTKAGWTITHDPLTLVIGKRDLLIDIGAERIVGAERNGERIAVEIKSFLNPSPVQDLKEALGQFILYSDILAQDHTESDRILFLAIRETSYEEIFEEPIGEVLLANHRLRLILFDEIREEITRWIN
ncbi:MAG: element excision factor XisH family protein [Capsulimonadales bacterium]|nr:element excision factor XisH family protein [Capsulimonadales bacterium]